MIGSQEKFTPRDQHPTPTRQQLLHETENNPVNERDYRVGGKVEKG
jgi:hypothetical protein